MECLVNGKEVSIDFKSSRNFDDMMKTIVREVVCSSAVITRIAVNGEFITEEREKALGGLPKEDIASIEVETRHPLDLAHETMQTGLAYVERLMEALRGNARAFRMKDGIATTESDFQLCIEGLQWFYSMIESLRGPLHISADEKVHEQKTFAQSESEAASALNEICDAREKGDTSAMADAIEYELIPNLDTWRQWLLRNVDVNAALKKL